MDPENAKHELHELHELLRRDSKSARLTPPHGLRNRIICALEGKTQASPPRLVRSVHLWAVIAACAAALLLIAAIWVLGSDFASSEIDQDLQPELTPAVATSELIERLLSPSSPGLFDDIDRRLSREVELLREDALQAFQVFRSSLPAPLRTGD